MEDTVDSFRVYGGGYDFDGDHTERVSGWRTRFTVDVTSDVQIGARFQRDDERGSQGFIEATFRFPFGSKRSFREEGLRSRLDESPERDIDIVTGTAQTGSGTGERVPVINQATGTAQTVLHVDNTAAGGGDGSQSSPFNTLAAAEAAATAHDIIYVHTGDGTATGQNAGITLDDTGQQLIGQGSAFTFDGSRFRVSGVSPGTGTLIAPAGTAPVITNAAGDAITVTADNVTLSGLTIDGASNDGIVIEADGAAASATNVTVMNVTTQNNTRHGLYVHAANDGSASAMIQSTTATTNGQHGMVIYDDSTAGSATADLGGGSMGSAGNNVLAANTMEDLAVDTDGAALFARNNWWGQASGPDTDDPSTGIDPQIYYGAPLNDGLVGHWTFDTEWLDATTAYDTASNNGNFNNGLSLADQVSGVNRDALDFDGIDDYVSMGDVLENVWTGVNAQFTVSLWMYRSNLTNSGVPVGKLSDSVTGENGRQWMVSARDSGLNGQVDFIWYGHLTPTTFRGWRSTTTNVGLNQWQHVAAVYDGTQVVGSRVTLYIDGMDDNATLSLSQGFPSTIQNGPAPLAIGVSSNSTETATGYELDGLVDDVRIYDASLSATEIAELYRMDASTTIDTSGFLTSSP